MANSVRRSLKGAPQVMKRIDDSRCAELESENQKAENEGSVGAADIRIRKTQQASLSRKFMQVIAKYNDLQATMRRKQRDVVKRQCQVGAYRVHIQSTVCV